MKSSIKVDYDSIYEGQLGDKEPVVKVKIQESDDPRDTLLRCIFTPASHYEVKLKTINNDEEIYVIYKKNRNSQICDLWDTVFFVMIAGIPDASRLVMIISNDEIYYEQQPINDGKPIRSKGMRRQYELQTMNDEEIREAAVKDFQDFYFMLK